MFAKTPVHKINEEIVFGMMRPVVVADTSDEIYVMPKSGEGRLDLVSALFYGTPQLWWVIASVNDLTDPLVGAAAGTQIRVPQKSRLAAAGIINS